MLPQLVEWEDVSASRQRGEPALCARDRAEGLPVASRLARVAAYHSAYRHDVSGRDGGRAQRGGAAVRRLVEGGKSREKGVFTDGDRRVQGWSEDGARLLSPGVDNGARLLYICVDPQAGAAR